MHKHNLKSQASRFLMATIISASLSFALPILFHEMLAVSEELSVAISLIIVFLINFVILRNFVFLSGSERALPQFIKFASSSIVFRVSEYAMFWIVFRFLGLNYILSLAIALGLSFTGKFFFHRSFVFRT